jgi:hypothetical protein
VIVVAACREFDVKYDPLLRERSWSARVLLKPLDFDREVSPLLRQWQVNPETLDPGLRELLRTPQHLGLFHKIAQTGGPLALASAQQLHNVYLEELVEKDHRLGASVLGRLQNLATELQGQRRQEFLGSASGLAPDVRTRLQSQEILVATGASSFRFGHQSLAEALVIRGALARGQRLSDFVAEQAPLPFIRPTVRAFYLYLRAVAQHDEFERESRRVLAHERVAVHLKRLIVESLADLQPTSEDWSLVRHIFVQYPVLFQRLLARSAGGDWFRFFQTHWLPTLSSAPERERWHQRFLERSTAWLVDCAAETVQLWLETLRRGPTPQVASMIASALCDLPQWNLAGVREVFELLVEQSASSVGKPLSQWVSAVGSGDDLVWRFIVRQVNVERLRGRGTLGGLRCASYRFDNPTFLEDRLLRSDPFMTLAIDALISWCGALKMTQGSLLWSTSYRAAHSSGTLSQPNELEVLLQAVENALKVRARQHDTWWQTNEPKLRSVTEAGLQYLLVQAYAENAEGNVSGIETQMLALRRFLQASLEFEFGTLLNAAFHLLAEGTQERLESELLALGTSGSGDELRWRAKDAYHLLSRVPAPSRGHAAAAFLDEWRPTFGTFPPEPSLRSWNGGVQPPVNVASFLSLSNEEWPRLLKHYATITDHERREGSALIGGRKDLSKTVRQAASYDPWRFLVAFDQLHAWHEDYARAAVEGTADHVRFRTGNLHPDEEWKKHSQAPPLPPLAAWLQRFLDWQRIATCPTYCRDEVARSSLLQACAKLCTTVEQAEQLTLVLFRLLHCDDPEREDDSSDPDFVALNSERGKAAGAATLVCVNLLEADIDVPRSLVALLMAFAHDRARGVRAAVLNRLPYIAHKAPELGWRLAHQAFREPSSRLWQHGERFLYYQYRDAFPQVEPLLEKLRSEALDSAGATFGRISTLSSIAGHIPLSELMRNLEGANEDARKGAAEVFCANLQADAHTTTCADGIRDLLRFACPGAGVLQTIIQLLDTACVLPLNAPVLVNMVLDGAARCQARIDGKALLTWVARTAPGDLPTALDILERLHASRLVETWHSSELTNVLLEILREADLTDDEELIRRAVRLPDAFADGGLQVEGLWS